MIGVTEKAKAELSKVLADKVDHPEACLRLRVNGEGNLGIGIDIERPDDKVVEYEGATLLVVEPELADNLMNIAIDVEDSDEGSQLVIVDTPADN
jgi:Fe-S cluster assembly iron-binding protein IscA